MSSSHHLLYFFKYWLSDHPLGIRRKRVYFYYYKHPSSLGSGICLLGKKRRAEMLHTCTSTPSRARATGHLTGALNSQTQRIVTGIKPGPHDHETSIVSHSATALMQIPCNLIDEEKNCSNISINKNACLMSKHL